MIRACILLGLTGLLASLFETQAEAQSRFPVSNTSLNEHRPKMLDQSTIHPKPLLPQSNNIGVAQNIVGNLDQGSSRPRKLTRPRSSGFTRKNSSGKTQTVGSIWTTIGALSVVIALIFIAAKVLKKHVPSAIGGVPLEAIEVLGKRHIDQRQAIHLIRCGSRILIVGSSPAGLNTLAEFTEPVEVDYLAGLCQQNATGSSVVDSFRTLFRKQQPLPKQSAQIESSQFGFSTDEALKSETEFKMAANVESALENIHG